MAPPQSASGWEKGLLVVAPASYPSLRRTNKTEQKQLLPTFSHTLDRQQLHLKEVLRIKGSHLTAAQSFPVLKVWHLKNQATKQSTAGIRRCLFIGTTLLRSRSQASRSYKQTLGRDSAGLALVLSLRIITPSSLYNQVRGIIQS